MRLASPEVVVTDGDGWEGDWLVDVTGQHALSA